MTGIQIVFTDDTDFEVPAGGETHIYDDGWLHVAWTAGDVRHHRTYPAHMVRVICRTEPWPEPF